MRLHRYIAAEIQKPLEQAADGLGSVLAVEVLAADVVVLGAIAQHVEGGGEHRGSHCEDGLFGAATGRDAKELSVERRLPALSSLRGHKPAQETRWPAVGKRDMSTPISATTTVAVRSEIPGIVVSRRARCWIAPALFPRLHPVRPACVAAHRPPAGAGAASCGDAR